MLRVVVRELRREGLVTLVRSLLFLEVVDVLSCFDARIDGAFDHREVFLAAPAPQFPKNLRKALPWIFAHASIN